MSIEASIEEIRAAVAQKFGKMVDTETGEGTLTIGHDRIELTDEDGRVLCVGAAKCAEVLES